LGFLFGTLALSSMMDLANLNYLLHGQVAHDFCGFAATSFCFWEYIIRLVPFSRQVDESWDW
jgi:hypothetical protein